MRDRPDTFALSRNPPRRRHKPRAPAQARLGSTNAVVAAALVALTGGALTAAGCGSARISGSAANGSIPPPPLTAEQIAELIPDQVRDARGWGEAILNALAANEIPADPPSACAVIAILGQESNFHEDPVVPGLAKLVRARIDGYKSRLGPLGGPLFERLLAGHAPDDARSFQQRLDTVRTERDVDVLFRDLLAYYEVNHPAMFEALRWAGKLVDVADLADLNPVTTAGSMQVSVRFAEQWARAHKGRTATADSVRDALYTRAGGVYFGTARLLAYPVHYDQTIFRFADYNAGFYSSRNAALQAELAQLTGTPLVPDGDLLAYQKSGEPRDDESTSEGAVRTFAERFAPRLSARDIRRDLLAEKSLAFEDTETYRAIRTAAQKRSGAAPAYARLPTVTLNSPKLSRTLSTAWFAEAVDRRYQACLGRSPTSRDRR